MSFLPGVLEFPEKCEIRVVRSRNRWNEMKASASSQISDEAISNTTYKIS
jgi:hypothetical protein